MSLKKEAGNQKTIQSKKWENKNNQNEFKEERDRDIPKRSKE